ncbi:esterase/lipase family protein [Rhodocyclus gracilis]|uniref:Alpha/beta fold hydrolase n=1 Tax=Rhodocyclus tenuis TaxID=1066 RepID=A0A6L5JWD6_RHOTE|nr:alpha/beta fold hydrolase [Rhodocyclus gracilis]MQY50498.1 alpha/beta fold hydrolase [Rhodocyclus gracilis]
MLAVSLLAFILCEVVLYFSLARHFFDVTPSVALLVVAAGLLGVRAAVNALSWAVATTWRAPWPALGAARFALMVLADYAAFVFCFVLVLPLERLWLGADRLDPANPRPPLLLIHGYGCSRGVWWWMRGRLERAGWNVATVNLEPVCSDIDAYAASIHRRIDAVCKATGRSQVVLIGHSMGGLAARAYVRKHGAARVARVLTLGTPHRGSRLAHLGIGDNARQMQPESDWLQRLARVSSDVDTVVIYSPHDNYVMPQTLLELPGVPQRRVDGVGHLAMLFSPRVVATLLVVLAAPSLAGEAVAADGVPPR